MKSKHKVFNRRVLIGLSDIASSISLYAEGFKQNGWKLITQSLSRSHKYQNSQIDFVLENWLAKSLVFGDSYFGRVAKRIWNKIARTVFFYWPFFRCDTYVFIFCTYRADLADLPKLRRKGKKIVGICMGDDVRWHAAMKKEFENCGLTPCTYQDDYDYGLNGLETRLRYLRNLEKYCDAIFGQPNYMQLALRPYYNLFLPVEIDSGFLSRSQRQVPVIIHAPSSPRIKGTEHIIQAISRLRSKGFEFEFELITGVPREQALKKYKECDILVDQLYLPGGGMLALELLSLGKVVLTSMAYDKYPQLKPPECPFVDVSPDTLEEVLANLISDLDRRTQLAARGRSYVETHHSPRSVVARIIETLENPLLIPDFKPTFFRTRFVPESAETSGLYRKWTQYVQDCHWYEK